MKDMVKMEMVSALAKRASALFTEVTGKKNGYKVFDAFLDIEAADAQVPMDLQRLMLADDGNFGHDVFGIRQHLNRSTKKLENGFVPRFAMKEAA